MAATAAAAMTTAAEPPPMWPLPAAAEAASRGLPAAEAAAGMGGEPAAETAEAPARMRCRHVGSYPPPMPP